MGGAKSRDVKGVIEGDGRKRHGWKECGTTFSGSRCASLITHLAHFGGRMDIALDTLEEGTVVL